MRKHRTDQKSRHKTDYNSRLKHKTHQESRHKTDQNSRLKHNQSISRIKA